MQASLSVMAVCVCGCAFCVYVCGCVGVCVEVTLAVSGLYSLLVISCREQRM